MKRGTEVSRRIGQAPKVLICATIDEHIEAFHLPVLQWFEQQGWEVHVATNGTRTIPFVHRKIQVQIERSPLATGNWRAYRQLKALIDKQDYTLIHCHTPMGGALARLAARSARKKGTKVIYTAHGFHFCKGSSLASWLTYYPAERLLAPMTDLLLTINKEDTQLAQRHRFAARSLAYVPGVGVDSHRYCPLPGDVRLARRRSLGYQDKDILLMCAAEFTANKNQELLIRSLALLRHFEPRLRLLFAGEGKMRGACEQLAQELGVSSQVEFLGWRRDVAELLPLCDVGVSASYREGLPVNIMEAMACGLPIVAVHNRGHAELVHTGRNGFLTASDPESFASSLAELCGYRGRRERMGAASLEFIAPFTLPKVMTALQEIYRSYMPSMGNKTVAPSSHPSTNQCNGRAIRIPPSPTGAEKPANQEELQWIAR